MEEAAQKAPAALEMDETEGRRVCKAFEVIAIWGSVEGSDADTLVAIAEAAVHAEVGAATVAQAVTSAVKWQDEAGAVAGVKNKVAILVVCWWVSRVIVMGAAPAAVPVVLGAAKVAQAAGLEHRISPTP